MTKPSHSFYVMQSKILTLALRFSVLFTSSSNLSPRIATLSANHKIYTSWDPSTFSYSDTTVCVWSKSYRNVIPTDYWMHIYKFYLHNWTLGYMNISSTTQYQIVLQTAGFQDDILPLDLMNMN